MSNPIKNNWVPIAINDVLTFVLYKQVAMQNMIESTVLSSDNKFLQIQIKGNFVPKSNFNLFINSDKNEDTGYSRDGKLKGADFLVEDNGVLYQYPKDVTSWKWDKVQDAIVFSHTNTMIQMDISSILLNNTKSITYYAMASTIDGKENNVFDGKYRRL